MQSLRLISYLSFLLFLLSCSTFTGAVDNIIEDNAGLRLIEESFGAFNEPWAMTFLPNGDCLKTEKNGTLLLVHIDDRSKGPVKGVPEVAYGGQGDLGDIVLHPQQG